LKIDTYRASGAGGQHVNKTESAVRITHIPTGVVAASQEEKAQHKNKARAMKMLKAKLYERELARRDAENAAYQATKSSINFGSQIRNYVLAPYRLVKDVRTGTEMNNVDAVLDGDLESFIETYLLAAAGGTLRKGGQVVSEDDA
ncbi:MAG TPA: peptide chain release factor-like protein, partial [Polyangium sp.]|nr:peptide chain release factor-like protein [Polyangium sp.]